MGGFKKVLKAATGIFTGGDTPKVVKQDPVADDKAAQEKADEAAAIKSAEDKRKKKQQSLLSTGGESGNGNGKTTLGA